VREQHSRDEHQARGEHLELLLVGEAERIAERGREPRQAGDGEDGERGRHAGDPAPGGETGGGEDEGAENDDGVVGPLDAGERREEAKVVADGLVESESLVEAKRRGDDGEGAEQARRRPL
jgi:hypothetical protein